MWNITTCTWTNHIYFALSYYHISAGSVKEQVYPRFVSKWRNWSSFGDFEGGLGRTRYFSSGNILVDFVIVVLCGIRCITLRWKATGACCVWREAADYFGIVFWPRHLQLESAGGASDSDHSYYESGDRQQKSFHKANICSSDSVWRYYAVVRCWL